MTQEISELAKEIADLRREMRALSDEADRLTVTRIIEDADVRRLLERMAGVNL